MEYKKSTSEAKNIRNGDLRHRKNPYTFIVLSFLQNFTIIRKCVGI